MISGRYKNFWMHWIRGDDREAQETQALWSRAGAFGRGLVLLGKLWQTAIRGLKLIFFGAGATSLLSKINLQNARIYQVNLWVKA